jgi:dTDP-4-dehydrorhamnose 3,5-epimerase-like enzyme
MANDKSAIRNPQSAIKSPHSALRTPHSAIEGVRWVELPSRVDERGVLTSVEGAMDVPFEIERVFYMHHIITDRGGHAHADTDQVVIAAAGRFKMDLSDGTNTQTYVLDDPTRGVYTPRMVFIRLYDFSPGAVCLVLASTHYDISKSIRSWEDYLKAMQA